MFKAVAALAVGFIIGMSVGHLIVRMIQSPLTNALETFYKQKSVDELTVQLTQRAEAGDLLAKRMLDDPALSELVKTQGMLCEQRYVMPDELLAELQQLYPERFGDAKLPDAGDQAIGRNKLIPILLWHSILDDPRVRPQAWSAQEPFVIWMKASFLAGAIISSPFVFYFLWSFVAAGLYPHEKRYVHIFLPFSVGLFLLGALTAFLLVFPPVLRFFFSFNTWLGIDTTPRISEWLSFVLLMPLAFGVSFQLPLVMLFLERIGIFTIETYWSKWRIAVLVIAGLSMVLSPGGDPNSMLLMMVPLVGLYFVGIGLCRWMPSPGSQYAPS